MSITPIEVDFIQVLVEDELLDNPAERNRLAFEKAQALAPIYIVPEAWEIVSDDGWLILVKRTRFGKGTRISLDTLIYIKSRLNGGEICRIS